MQRADATIAALTESLPIERRFGPERIAEMYEFYLGEDPAAPSAAEVAGELPAGRLALLPPTVIVNAEADDLRASAEQFAGQLRASGVNVSEIVQPGTVHGYLNRPDESPRATRDAQTTIDPLLCSVTLWCSERDLARLFDALHAFAMVADVVAGNRRALRAAHFVDLRVAAGNRLRLDQRLALE